MFDPSVCNEMRKCPRPQIEPHALLEIAHLLELDDQRKITACDERNSNNQTEVGTQITNHPNTPPTGRGDPSGEANSSSRKSRVRGSVKAIGRGGRNAERAKRKRRAK